MKCRLPIQSISELATALGISVKELWRIANNANNLYSRWQEPKPSGGMRDLSSPYPPLKPIQQKLHKLVFAKIAFTDPSHYGIKSKSNITNARQHKGCRAIFTFDLKSFFPSIRPERVHRALVDELGCPEDLASLLTKLVTCNYQLPQGAPTSTDIANIVTFRLQRRLSGLAKQWGLSFTIYADDVTFSGTKIPDEVTHKIKAIIQGVGYRIHPTKGGVFDKSCSQIVTGINLAHGGSVGKTMKLWRAQLHQSATKFATGEISEDDMLRAQKRYKGRKAYAESVKKLLLSAK